LDTKTGLASIFSTKAMGDMAAEVLATKGHSGAAALESPGFSEVQALVAWGQLVALSLGGEQVIVLSDSRQGIQDSPEDPHRSQSGKLVGANR